MTFSMLNYSTLDYCLEETSEIWSFGFEARIFENHRSGSR